MFLILLPQQKFIVGGQALIINDQSLPLEERFAAVQQLIRKVLN